MTTMEASQLEKLPQEQPSGLTAIEASQPFLAGYMHITEHCATTSVISGCACRLFQVVAGTMWFPVTGWLVGELILYHGIAVSSFQPSNSTAAGT